MKPSTEEWLAVSILCAFPCGIAFTLSYLYAHLFILSLFFAIISAIVTWGVLLGWSDEDMGSVL